MTFKAALIPEDICSSDYSAPCAKSLFTASEIKFSVSFSLLNLTSFFIWVYVHIKVPCVYIQKTEKPPDVGLRRAFPCTHPQGPCP